MRPPLFLTSPFCAMEGLPVGRCSCDIQARLLGVSLCDPSFLLGSSTTPHLDYDVTTHLVWFRFWCGLIDVTTLRNMSFEPSADHFLLEYALSTLGLSPHLRLLWS